MSQKDGKFQSKSKFGGQKSGGKGPGGKGGGKPGGARGFGKKFEGDRPSEGRTFSKPRSRPEGGAPRKGGFGGKPRFDRDDRKGGGDAERKPRFERDGERKPGGFGGKPRFDRDDRKPGGFGKKPRFDNDRGGDRKPGGFGGKPRFDRDDRKPGGDSERKPRFERDGERKPGGFGGKPRFDRDDRKPGGFGKKPRFDNDRGGDRKPGGFGGKPRFDRDDRKPGGFGGKPRFSRDDDRKGGGFDKKPRFERRDSGEGDKPRFQRDNDRGAERGGDRGGERKFGGKKNFKEREDRAGDTRPSKPWQRYEEKPRGEASVETREKLKSGRPALGAPSSAFLYGVHAVSAALLNPKRAHQRLLCTEGGYKAIGEACRKAAELGLRLPEVTFAEKEDISRLLPRDAVHQDVLLDCQPLEEVFLVDIINDMPADAKVIVLDQVTDPHNVGAILRSAAAFGAVAVVVQKLHAPEITGTVAKAASGAAEHVPMVREVNLSRAIVQLREAGFLCVGLAEDGKEELGRVVIPGGRTALVLGAEGDGLRRLVAESCDTLARLPTGGPIGSLNVSNAAAVGLYELARAGGK